MLLPLSRRTIKAAMNRRKHRPGQNHRSGNENRDHAHGSPHRPDSAGKPPHAGAPRGHAPAPNRKPGSRPDSGPDSGPQSALGHKPAPGPRPGPKPGPRPGPERSRGRGHGKAGNKGATWLYGQHACLAALANPDRYIHRLILTRDALAQFGPGLPAGGPQPEILERARLDTLLPPGAVHQGIALQVEPLDDPGVESLAAPPAAGHDIVLLLDQVTDPRNIGAILRSAAAFGARALIVTDRHAPEATGALAKAASGGLEAVPMLRVGNLVRALDLLAEYGFWRVGLAADADRDLAAAVSDVKRLALVLGAEDTGLRRLTAEHCDFLAHLPMPGLGPDAVVESLNVSVAASIALYEAAKRSS